MGQFPDIQAVLGASRLILDTNSSHQCCCVDFEKLSLEWTRSPDWTVRVVESMKTAYECHEPGQESIFVALTVP